MEHHDRNALHQVILNRTPYIDCSTLHLVIKNHHSHTYDYDTLHHRRAIDDTARENERMRAHHCDTVSGLL